MAWNNQFTSPVDIVVFIRDYNQLNGVSPTFQEIRQHFKMKKTNCDKTIHRLITDGFIVYRKARDIQIVKVG